MTVAQEVTPDTLTTLRARFGTGAVDRQLATLTRDRDAVDDPDLWLTCALEREFKDMPIERVSRCPCGGSDLTRLSRFVFWNLLGVSRCRRCGLVLVSPRLTSSAMARVFNETYFADADPAYWGRRREPVFREIVATLRQLGCGRIADVGAAYGHFLRYAADRGIQGVGCDLSAPVVEWGRRTLGVDLRHGSIEVLADVPPVDAVVSLDTLYYSPDPARELARMRDLLQAGGYIVLRLRNNRGAAQRGAREGQRAVGRPVMPSEHLYGFEPAPMARLLDAAGLQLVRCTPATYSEHRWNVPLRSFAAINRAGRALHPSFPVLTHSFNVIARRA